MSFLNFRRACGALVLALSVSLAACGGDDDKDGDNDNNDRPDLQFCQDVADKIYGCDLSCELIPKSTFSNQCVDSQPRLSQEERDAYVEASCDEIDAVLCDEGGGGDPAFCSDIADKIYGCDVSCADQLIPQSQFETNCSGDPPTASERDSIVNASCADLDEAVCSQ